MSLHPTDLQYCSHLLQAWDLSSCVAPVIARLRAAAAAWRSATSWSCWGAVISQNVPASVWGSESEGFWLVHRHCSANPKRGHPWHCFFYRGTIGCTTWHRQPWRGVHGVKPHWHVLQLGCCCLPVWQNLLFLSTLQLLCCLSWKVRSPLLLISHWKGQSRERWLLQDIPADYLLCRIGVCWAPWNAMLILDRSKHQGQRDRNPSNRLNSGLWKQVRSCKFPFLLYLKFVALNLSPLHTCCWLLLFSCCKSVQGGFLGGWGSGRPMGWKSQHAPFAWLLIQSLALLLY